MSDLSVSDAVDNAKNAALRAEQAADRAERAAVRAEAVAPVEPASVESAPVEEPAPVEPASVETVESPEGNSVTGGRRRKRTNRRNPKKVRKSLKLRKSRR